ncbi:hypothetical protein JL09_g6170, partial [Pichia kudriavzevii]
IEPNPWFIERNVDGILARNSPLGLVL